MKSLDSDNENHNRLARALLVAYLLLLAYGSLYPLSGWDWQRGGLGNLFHSFSLKHLSRSDVVTNLAVYMPLGLLMMLAWNSRAGLRTKIMAIAAWGTAMSLGMEYLQSYLPARVSSVIDAALNCTGTLTGALLAHGFALHSISGTRLHRLRHRLFFPGPPANLGLAIMGLWLLSQLTPLVPSLDRGTLVEGIRPILNILRGFAQFNGGDALSYALNTSALGVIAATLLRPNQRFLPLFGVFIGSVLILKIPIVSRQLSLEALIGAGSSLLVLPLLTSLKKNTRLFMAGAMLLLAYAIDQLHSGTEPHSALHAMNWIPFRGQMQDVVGLEDIVAGLWSFAALAYIVLVTRPRSRRADAAVGAVLVFAFAFALEWRQTGILGRYPDITDVCLAVLGWYLPWLFPSTMERATEVNAISADPPLRLSPRKMLLAMMPALAIIGLMMGLNVMITPSEPLREEHPSPQLPAPEDLAPVSLSHFLVSHPRLPAPTPEDIARLQSENRPYLNMHRKFANGGQGQLPSAILMAYLEPGSQDLNLIHQKLMALKVTWRGHDQVKPMAIAYDWLYAQWSEEQRQQLRDKLVDGCNYEIDFIRKQTLSPYNVYLYNSPFQALMACSIAVYKDDPRGDPIMAFTSDMWKNRILPVWRQVMGKNGGWHEGGEYVGIGIGQAIYQLPNMWRRATGEDYFKTEPGIRGFLDFLVYRTRPDGTHMRLGDAAWFDKDSPDRLALALEYRHAAAYSLRRPPKAPTPTSWPWGPLTDNTLYDKTAVEKLPYTAYFDGIGLVVMRSGWGPDATYITFKAGDNYWSHSHLDQGAFTIYKGGELAIDSGLYVDYGSDHHLNYDYQTIAHNVATVTDPDDTVPMPPKGDTKAPRPIANDGGQRRVGSGWGVEAAPLDLAEWNAKRDIYHTGTITQLTEQNDFVTVTADITPAYTNKYSGQGTFSDRTRRVDQYTRSIVYDRINDVVLIYDTVTKYKLDFAVRWLIHFQEQPALLGENHFQAIHPPKSNPQQSGGILDGQILLPAKPEIAVIGGQGKEFWVGGRNYDNNGEVYKAMRRKNNPREPGAWRIEISPDKKAEKTDHFLIELAPKLSPTETTPSVHCAQAGNTSNCILSGKREIKFQITPNGIVIDQMVGNKDARNRSSSPIRAHG